MNVRDRSRGSVVSWIIVFFLATIVLGACGADQSSSDEGDAPPAAVAKARDALATELDVETDEVAIESYKEAEWSDSCLGLGGPAESCLAAIHLGWQVMLSVDGELYEVRTDELGDIIRFKQ